VSVIPLTEYESEHRLAVVMYGGVSLAIYIGGVARELLGVVRATAPSPDDPAVAGLSDEELTAAERIYRRIAQTTEGAATFAAAPAAPLRRNVTIDIITGTSAGGMNGVFLAKALANDRTLDELLKLWVEEGDLAKLLNDAESVRGTALAPTTPPPSLLNGRRIYLKLLEAFDDMDDPKRKDPPPAKPRFDNGRVDLFVTTTDVRGEVVTLPVSNAVATEHRYRQRFHFTAESSDSGRNELSRDDNPLLAFAARCTSSFPVAFEPFTWADAVDIVGSRAKAISWTERLMYVGDDYDHRPFCDGGYLDNKPFSYAIDELARRQSHLKVKRTLFYVEPDPQMIDQEAERKKRSQKPDAIENALAALSVPGYETIREDLERVVERNARVGELEEMEAAMISAASAIEPLAGDEWTNCRLGDLVRRYGPGYPSYHRTKLHAVTDWIAELICSTSSVGRPELMQVVRDLVREWVSTTYMTFGDQLQFLLDADIDFRLRKIGFVLRRSGTSVDVPVVTARNRLKLAYDAFYRIRRKMRGDLEAEVNELRKTLLGDAALARMAMLSGEQRKAEIAVLLAGTADSAQALSDYLATSVRDDIRIASLQARLAVEIGADGGDIPNIHPDVGAMRLFFRSFEAFDMVTFPIVQNGGVDEGVPVDVVRISPRDARQKVTLASASLGHFGGFLEDDWRRNDILWGRLNASEAIVRQLVPDRAAAEPLIDEMHEAIVNEMLLPELTTRLANARTPKVPVSILSPSEQKRQQRAVDAAARGLINDPATLCGAFKTGSIGYDLDIDRAKQVRSAGRAGVVIEQMLRSAAVKARFDLPGFFRWSALGAMVLTQIAIPRSFHRTIAAYWGRLLALLFAVVAVAGTIVGKQELTWAGVKGFLAVGLIAIATSLITAWIGERLMAAVFRIAAWMMAIGAVGYLVRFGFTLRPPELSGFLRNMKLVTEIEIFFLGVALGLFLMSGLLSVVEDGRAALRWLWRLVWS
jgi:patatin-related protein